MINCKCPSCGKSYKLKDEAEGRLANCQCGKQFRVVAVRQAELMAPAPQELQPVPRFREEAAQPAAPATFIQVNQPRESRAAHSLGVSSLVLGILSFFVCWVPVINFVLGGVALSLGVGGVLLSVFRRGSGLGYCIAGIAVSSLVILLATVQGFALSSIFDGVSNSPGRSPSRAPARAPARAPETVGDDNADIAPPEPPQNLVDVYKQFEVHEARLLPPDLESFSFRPSLYLRVTNNTEHTVSRAYFNGVYFTPGRTLAWAEAEFNYEIPGGLEPGESAEWTLSLGFLNELGKAEVRDDAVLQVTVSQLDGHDGEPIPRFVAPSQDATTTPPPRSA